MSKFLAEARAILPELILWRRDFHQHPELRFEEVHTSSVVTEHLRSLGMEVRTGIGKTGVVGILRGVREDPVALIRVDMDALPIQEETNLEFKSAVPGVMHACGHDSHTAMGMGAAKLLAARRNELQGTVMFVFQPAEEGAGGARAMIAEGALKDPKPDLSFGIHIQAQTPNSLFLIGDGPILAAADRFRIVIHGKGGHGAEPQKTVDTVVVAGQIINALQTVISRNVDPLKTAIISIGSVHAGRAFNVIPEVAELEGTIRWYDEDVQQRVYHRMEEIVKNTALAMGATAELEIDQIVPAVVNHPVISAKVREMATEIFGSEHVSNDELGTPSDDVSEFLRAAPGCHFVIGAAPNDNPYPHHNPRFELDEKVMPLGVALICEEITYFLANWELYKGKL